MINYYEPVDFSKTVYTIDFANQKIIEHTLRDLCLEWGEETTTPHGIGKKAHVRGTELWTWGQQGNYPHKITDFDSEKEAEHACMLSHLYDLDDGKGDAPNVYYTIDAAKAALQDFIE